MATTLDEQITQLKNAIAEIEAQRSILGDEAVDARSDDAFARRRA